MKKRMVSVILSAAMVSAMMTGLGSANVMADEEKEVVLTLIDHTSEEAKINYENQAIERFEADHPNVTVEVQRMSMDDYKQTLATKYASDDAPDLYVQDNTEIKTFIENGYCADLTDTAAAARLSEGGAAPLSQDGRIYGIPMQTTSFVVTYNKAAFEKAGITEVPKTTTQLREACEKLQEAGIAPFGLGYGESWVILGDIQTDYLNNWLTYNQTGIQEMQSRERTFTEDPYWRGALERLAERYHYANNDPFGTDWTSACTMLVNGECAMIVNGDWVTNNCTAYGDVSDFGAFALPVSEDEKDLTLMKSSGGQGWCVNAGSPNLELAEELVAYFVDEESVAYFVENCNELCVVKDVDLSTITGPLADVMAIRQDENVNVIQYDGQGGFDNEFFDALGACLADFLLNGGEDVDGALAALDAEFDRIANQ